MPFTDQQIEQFQSYGQEACQEAIGAMTPEQQADLAQSVQAYNERKAGKQPDAIQGFVSSGVPVGHAASVATGAAPDNGPVVQQRQPELDQFMQATKIPYGLGGPSGQTVSEQNTQLQAQGKAPLADWQRDLQGFQLSNGAMTQKRSDNALWLDPSKGDASRHGWYWWTATGWQKAPDAPSAISGAYNKYNQAMMAPGAATVGLVKGAAQELVHGTAKTFGNLAKFMGQTPGAPTSMTTPNLVPYGITDEYKKAYLQGANELGNDIISGNEAAEAAENKSLPSQTAAGKTGEYVGKQVGTFAKAAVGGMPLLGAEAFLNRYGAVAGEGEDQTNVMKGMTAGLADATLLNVVSKIPGMTPDKVASVRGAIAKSLLLDAPLEAGVQTLGGVAIDKLVLGKNVSTSDVVDSYLHNLAAFAGFKAMGLKEVVKAERANSDWINENIGKNFSSYEDAKTNIAAFISEVSKDATQEPTPQKMAAIDAARQSLAILEKAEKSGRRIKWSEPETAAATTVKPTETSTNTQERLAQPTDAIAPQETSIGPAVQETRIESEQPKTAKQQMADDINNGGWYELRPHITDKLQDAFDRDRQLTSDNMADINAQKEALDAEYMNLLDKAAKRIPASERRGASDAQLVDIMMKRPNMKAAVERINDANAELDARSDRVRESENASLDRWREVARQNRNIKENPNAIQEQGAGEMGAQPRGTEGVGEQAGGVRPSEQGVEPARAQVGPEVAKPEVLAQREEGKVDALASKDPQAIADTFGAQHVYEHLVEKMGLPKDATVGDIAGYTFGKIKTLGKNVAETTAKIITQIKGITRDAASRLAQILHDNFSSNGKRKGERGAIAFGGDVEAGRSRSWYDLDKASKDDVVSVIRKSVDEYSASPERAVEDYKKIPDSRDGRIVSGDASRLLHEGYAQNPNWGGGAFGQLGDGYLNKEMAINKSLRDYAIKRSAEDGKDGAIMVGGQGSGKTTLSKELIDSNGNIGVVLDGLHMDKDEIHFLAEKMKREGVYPHVIMVDTPPERAFKNTLVRSEYEIRHVNPDFFIKAHDRASKGFLDYADGNPKDVTLHRASNDGKSFSLTRGAEAVDAIRAEKRLSPEELAESVRKTYLEAKENGRVRSDVARSIEAGSESIGARGSETAGTENAAGDRGPGRNARTGIPEAEGSGSRMGREEIKNLVNDFYAGDINKYNRASVYRDEKFWQSKTPEKVNELLLTHSESKLDVADPQLLADTFGGQQVYERITKKMGLPEDASLRQIGEFTMGKIKSIGKTVAETTNKILSRVAGIGREAASKLAHFLHNEWENFKKRNGEEGAVRLDNPFFKKMMTEGGASEFAGMAKNLGAKPEAEKPEAIERKVDNYTQALDFGNPERGSVGIGDAKEVAKGIANIATATPKKAASTFSKLGNFVDESARRSMLATKKSVSKLSPKAETELVKVARQLDKAGLLQHRVSPDATELPKGAGRIIDYQTPKVVKDIKAGISGKVQSMSWLDQHVFGKGQGGFAPDIYTQANRGAINAANFTDVKDNILKQNGIRDNGAEIEKLMNKPDASLGGKSIGEVLQQHLKTVHEYEKVIAEMEAKAKKQQYGDMQFAIKRFKTDNAPVYEKAKKLTEAAFRLGAKRVNESIALHPEARVFMLAQTDPEAIKKAHGSLELLSQKNNLTLDESRELENAKMLVKLDKLAKPNERKAAEGFRKMMDEIGSMLEDAGVSAKEPYYMPHTMLKGMKVDPMAPDDLIESLNYAKRTGNVTLMPSVNVALDRYLPNAARKISMQPVLDKWTAAINPDQPGSLTDPLAENRAENYAARIKDTLLEMQTPSDNDIFSKAFKFQRNFEVRKAIGLSVRTAIKHATKMVEISNEHGVHMAPGAKDVLIGATGDVLDAYANERGFTGNMVRKALVPVRNMLGVSELDAQQTAQFARNFLATAEMRKMMNEDPSSMEFAYSLNPHLAPASRGVTRSIGRGWGKLKNALGQPVSAVEALENFVNMASSIEKGGTHGLNQDQNIKAMIGNILAYDYKPHTDTPAMWKNKAARLLTAFTTTPHKNMELFSHMIARGLRGGRDIYGTSETSKMIRDMVAIGAVTAGASQIGWHFLHDKFHAPLVNMDWWEHAAKYGYNKFTGDDEQANRDLEAMQGNQDGPFTFFTPSESLMDMYRVLNTGDVMAPLKQSTAWKEYLAIVHGELPSSYETMSDYFLGNKTEESEARQEKFEVNKGKKQQMSHTRSNQRNTPQ